MGQTRNKQPFDGVTYRDTGCFLHPACLECPEPACIYDRPEQSYRRLTPAERLDRDAQVAEARTAGATVEEIRVRFGLSGTDYADALRRHARRMEDEARHNLTGHLS